MSSDDSDKTVFQSAVRGNPDHTAMRPMPGGRGATPGRQAPPQAPQTPPPVMPRQAPPQGSETPASFADLSTGLNPLVSAAGSLIAVFEKTKKSTSHPDIGGLHQRLSSEIRTFEAKLREKGYRPEIVLSARYVMCSVLDETVLNTPWGSESPWAQRTLLSVFHNETSGGEKFFLILDRMRQTPAENIDMIELMYVCLSLGFEGKYRLITRGRDAIEQIRDEIFSIIRNYRGEYERTLSESWEGLGKSKNTLVHYIPMWVIFTVAISLLFFGFGGFRYWLYESATPVVGQLESISSLAIEEEEEDASSPSALLKNRSGAEAP